ncbi:MAG: cation/H(+) antiporter [Porphyromonadaceae bacterium]|nr:cation/H(+) antiporter [Porphyromonadaceae bacterium]
MRKRDKSWWFFTFTLVAFAIVTYILIRKGGAIDVELHRKGASDTIGNFELFKNLTFENIVEPSAIILLQIFAILVVSRIFSALFAKIKQPTVIGEILAGIVLGPSLLGLFFPGAYHFLFSPDSLNSLYIISQIGLVLFMFTVGMDLNMSEMKENFKSTFIISQSSIVVPFLLGMILAFVIYRDFSPEHSNFTSFALFIGISMSITAFPVLARIVQEKGLTKSHLGTLSIGSAAINDVSAWLLLVAVIAIAKTGSFASSIYTLFFTVIYIALMLFAVRPFIKKIGEIYQNEELMNKSIFAFFILILIISAYTTQLLGIHALFGAFMAGLIMPPLPKFRRLIIDKIEDLSVTLLLPLFFVYTGLKTEIGLLNTPSLWIICLIFIVVAVVGKVGGSVLPARISGESWRDSLSLGGLMNTRGLMELIVLNIGLEMGILPPTIFVILVIMALVTTFMTTPLLHFIEKLMPDKKAKDKLHDKQAEDILKVLISLGNPASGDNLLRVAKKILDGAKNRLSVNVLHITAGTDLHPIYTEQFSVESFIDIQKTSEELRIPITTEYRVADNIESEIVGIVNNENYDFLLVGGGIQLEKEESSAGKQWLKKYPILDKVVNTITRDRTLFFPGTLIHDKTRYFIENSNCSVGVFINRDYKGISGTTVIPIKEKTDNFLLRYAQRILRYNDDLSVQILDMTNDNQSTTSIQEGIQILSEEFEQRVKIQHVNKIDSVHLEKYNFMLISYQAWENLLKTYPKLLNNIPSSMIINNKTSPFQKKRMKLNEETDMQAE